MIAYPNAKINLGLHVLNRRTDGYHNIETCMYPVPMYDILEIIPSGDRRFHFHTSGREITGPCEQNLCIKAIRAIEQEFPLPGVSIHLHKQIPMGAGLGGGSADAAFTLILTNRLFKLGLTPGELEVMAARIGSDVPFFIQNRPVTARGRGEVMEPISLDLKGWYLVMIKPGFNISTAEAYGTVTPVSGRPPLRDLVAEPIESWHEILVNDFEAQVLSRFPEASVIRKMLYEAGAVFAQMTGSGSVFFGLFRRETPLPEYLTSRLAFSGTLP